jgi:4-amino-4-deoxy-L-arabinose transferase-like glycosyltransferase
VFLALVVPYHATDALVYGRWSRFIADQGGFFFDQMGYTPYARPLFYLPQGELWWLFGAHEWIGRLLSLAFFGLLVWSVFQLARDTRLPPITPWLAVLLLFAGPDVVVQAFAGQTDVPVAAMIAVAAVLLWRRPWGRTTAALLVLVGIAAVLAKATALPALLGLGLAQLLGDRAGLPKRILQAVPLAAGAVIGLIYAVIMAHHFNLPLNDFLGGVTSAGPGGESAGGRVGGAVTSVAADTTRPQIVARVEWLGPYLRLLVLFAILYTLARLVGVRHRVAVFCTVPIAFLVYLIAPSVLAGEGTFASHGAGAVVGSFLLLVPLLASAWCPPEWIVSRLLMARLLVWTVPPLVAWALFGILEDPRTISPAWPPLFVMVAAVAAMGVAGLATRRSWAAAAAVFLLIGLALLNFRNFDGLGVQPDGSYDAVSALRKLGPSTWLHPDKARSAADAQLGGEVVAARAARPPGGILQANDGRITFYFLDDLVIDPVLPADCAALGSAKALALITRGIPAADQAKLGRLPCLTPVGVVPDSYAVYRVGAG